MASTRSPPTHRPKSKSDVRRALFRLNRSHKSSHAHAVAAAASSSSSSTIPSTSRPTSGPSPFNDDPNTDDGIIVRNQDGSIDVQLPNQTVLLQTGIKDLQPEEDHRIAELVKRHNSDMARKLPDLLRAHVSSLSKDNWIFEAETD